MSFLHHLTLNIHFDNFYALNFIVIYSHLQNNVTQYVTVSCKKSTFTDIFFLTFFELTQPILLFIMC